MLVGHNARFATHMVTPFKSSFYYNTIINPTRIGSPSAVPIDHMWTNDLLTNALNGIVHCSLSDHNLVFISKSKIL